MKYNKNQHNVPDVSETISEHGQVSTANISGHNTLNESPEGYKDTAYETPITS